MGLDPGFRTGVKVAVVDATGKVVATQTIHPHQPQRRWDEGLGTLARLARTHQVELIAIGNGTASRELPQLDVSLRGAVSIARRLQDPLGSWSRSTRGRSASASTSTTSRRAS